MTGASGTPELRQLRSFVVLADELHFGRAAQRLAISQPALSEQLRRLEGAVGAQLLERTTRHVRITPAGEALQLGAVAALRAADDALDSARRIAAEEPTSLRLGTSPVALSEVVPAAAQQLRYRSPPLELAVAEARPHDIVARLLRGELDAGLMLCPPEDDRLAYQLIRYERMFVALPADHAAAGRTAVTVHELRNAEVVTYPSEYPSSFSWSVAATWRRAGVNPTLREDLAFDESPGSVAGGNAVAVVPNGLPSAAVPPGVAVSRLHPPVAFGLMLLSRRDDPAPGVRALAATLRGCTRRGGWLRGAEFGVPLPFA